MKHPQDIEPDCKGTAARAWKFKSKVLNPDQEACLGMYLVNGPFHPLWDRWIVSVVHLRDLPGMTPAKKKSPEMTHEFIIMSVNPAAVVDLDDPSYRELGEPMYLDPADAVVQFEADSDSQASALLKQSVETICKGLASPDSDFRSFWDQAIPATIEHLRGQHDV